MDVELCFAVVVCWRAAWCRLCDMCSTLQPVGSHATAPASCTACSTLLRACWHLPALFAAITACIQSLVKRAKMCCVVRTAVMWAAARGIVQGGMASVPAACCCWCIRSRRQFAAALDKTAAVPGLSLVECWRRAAPPLACMSYCFQMRSRSGSSSSEAAEQMLLKSLKFRAMISCNRIEKSN